MAVNLDAVRSGRKPRTFLSEDADLGNWETVQESIQRLMARDIATRPALEAWLEDLSELEAALSEEYAARYIAMTCHTDDHELEARFVQFVQEIEPKTKPEFFALNKKYLASPARAELPREEFLVYDRAIENSVRIFREENVPLQTEDELLSQQYQKLSGEQVVEFRGKAHTMPQLAKYLEETDRGLRREAWHAQVERQLADREAMETIFDKMLDLRHRMALNAGFANFLEYQFARLGRFDYTPADCRAFHEAVESAVVPLRRELREARRKHLGLDRLAPYDLNVDEHGRPPLRPFENGEELAAGTRRIFGAVAPVFVEEFAVLEKHGLLDLESRKGKAPGGYQQDLPERGLPFIFMNATGRNDDVFTLLHEGGHAFHALLSHPVRLYGRRHAPIEFCEVASMGMEVMACERLESFYTDADAARARAMHLEDIIVILPWIARVDAFQHWLYTHPGHTRAEREAEWLRMDAQFGDDLDWEDLEVWRRCAWVRQLHFFCVPLYYIEYGIAQLGALQLWQRFRADAEGTVAEYRKALALGYTRPLPDLFGAAGLRFAFDEGVVGPLVREVRDALRAA